MDVIQFKLAKRGTYSPGDVVEGSCVIGMSDEIAARATRLDIVLRGRVEINVGRWKRRFPMNPDQFAEKYPGNCVTRLFEERGTLCIFDHRPSGDADSYAFRLRFPALASSSALMHSAEPVALPPSLMHESKGDPRPPVRNWFGVIRVFYELEAQILDDQALCLRKDAAQMDFASTSADPLPTPRTLSLRHPLTVKNHRLDKGTNEDRLTKTMQRLRISKPPVANMDVVVEIPSDVIVEEPLPIRIKIDFHPSTSTAASPPEVRIDYVLVQYKDVIRLADSVTFGPHQGPVSVMKMDSFIQHSQKFADDAIVINESTHFQKSFSSAWFIPKESTFDLPILSRIFTNLTVKMRITCSQTTFHLDFDSDHELHIHPRRTYRTPELHSVALGTEISSETAIVQADDAAARHELSQQVGSQEVGTTEKIRLQTHPHVLRPLAELE